MLEVFFVWRLCNVNKRHAIQRGKKPGGYIALTVILWVGMEFLGALIGAASGGEGSAYLFALIFAGIGGLIANLVAKSGDPVEAVTTSAESAHSQTPSQLN